MQHRYRQTYLPVFISAWCAPEREGDAACAVGDRKATCSTARIARHVAGFLVQQRYLEFRVSRRQGSGPFRSNCQLRRCEGLCLVGPERPDNTRTRHRCHAKSGLCLIQCYGNVGWRHMHGLCGGRAPATLQCRLNVARCAKRKDFAVTPE